MIFYSAFSGSRPVRTCENTRRFAWDSLHAVYGLQTYDTPALSADSIAGFDGLSAYDKYDGMISMIARQAPLRLCPDELLCGSATLGNAVFHVIPVTYEGKNVMGSVSHITCGFDRVLREGLTSYRERIEKRLSESCDEGQNRFLHSLLNVCEAVKVWHGRYLSLLIEKINNSETDDEKLYYTGLYENLAPVPFNPPVNYRQAMQALWFLFAFTRLCGNWPGLGRIDVMVGGLLEHDLSTGTITESEAREIMAHFFIKGCEWIRLDSRGSGDAQHYQNIVLAGCDENGNEVACTATKLALEAVEEFPISDYPIAVRINDGSPEWLIRKVAEVMRHGSGVAAVYNEKLIINSMVEFGYDLTEARRFANDGCWEVQVPGKTLFGYHPMDGLELFQRHVLGLYDDAVFDYDSFDDILKKYDSVLAEHMEKWHAGADGFGKGGGPSSVMALLEDDCIENALDYYCGGTRYKALSPHLGGMPDVANEMYAIKKLIYEEDKLSFTEFMKILKNNWTGNEDLRLYARRRYAYYGNDNDEVDFILAHIMDTFMDETRRVKCRSDVLRPAGISTFGRQIDWKDSRRAHAHGFKSGDILASNLSPTPGTDMLGATAVIKSHCKVDLSRLTCGTALDIKLDPTSVSGGDGIDAVMALLRGFVTLGGFFMQIDVMDNAVLLEAQRHPENYQNLSVRISGWSARFVTLSDEWQRMIIERTAMGV